MESNQTQSENREINCIEEKSQADSNSILYFIPIPLFERIFENFNQDVNEDKKAFSITSFSL